MALPPLEIAAPDHRATLCRVRIFVYLSKTIQNHAHYTIAKEVFQCARAYSSARAGGREGSLPFLLLSRSTPPTARHARRTAQCAAKDSPCRGTATARFLRNASAPKTAFIAQRPARTAPVARLSSRNAAKRPGAFQKQERPCRNWQGLWHPYQKLIQSGEIPRRGKNGARFYPRTPKGEKWRTGGNFRGLKELSPATLDMP